MGILHFRISEQSQIIKLDRGIHGQNMTLKKVVVVKEPTATPDYKGGATVQISFLGGGLEIQSNINSDEISFIRRCLRYMAAGKGEAIDDFRCIWVQMTRIRVLLYKHLVIDPERPGLDAFAEHFDHLGEYQNEQVENFALTTVCREPGLQLEHVELRKAPGGYSKLKKLQHQSESAKKECNIRWVLHFIRDDKRAKRVLQDLIRHHSETAVNLAATLRTADCQFIPRYQTTGFNCACG